MPGKFEWPEHARGAVSLTFDDNYSTHLGVAAPMLNEYGLRGTFYLPTGWKSFESTKEAWRDEIKRGHEIGDHSLKHPCSGCYNGIASHNDIGSYTMLRMEAEILESRRLMNEAFPEQKGFFSFSYPCYETELGEGGARESYIPLIKRYYLAARGLGTEANDPLSVDLEHVKSFDVSRISENLMHFVKQAVEAGKWVVLTFHGIGPGNRGVDSDMLEMLCGCLRAVTPFVIWVAPLIEVASYVNTERCRIINEVLRGYYATS